MVHSSTGRHRAAQRRTPAKRSARALGAALLVLAVTPWVGVGAAAAVQGDVPASGDDRAKSYAGNAVTCADAGLAGSIVEVTASDDGTYLDITAVPEGTTVSGVVVKGGNGYNVYAAGSLGELPWLELHAPVNASDNPAAISHSYVCGEATVVEDAQPSGTLSGVCVGGAYVVRGKLDDDGATDASYRLVLSTGTTISVSGASFEETIAAATGTTVVLQARVGSGDWVTVAGPVTVAECAEGTTTGTIKIRKVTEGDPIAANTDFTARVDCDGAQYDQDVALNSGNGWVNVTSSIPTGTACTVSEVNIPSAWRMVSVTPSSLTVGAGTSSDADVVVKNRRTVGQVTIVKEIVGDPAGASTEFTVQLDCPGTDYDATVTLNAANSWTRVFTDIPRGLVCSVSEPTVPAGWVLTSITATGETISAEGAFKVDRSPATITVTNTRVVAGEQTPQRGLAVVKAVSPTGTATFGATLTYSLTVSTTGNAAQTGVTVTDTIPTGTTYVMNSAACDAGSCSATVANGVVTWGLGAMAAGTSRTVTFAVTIDTPAAAADGSIPAVEIVNAGAVRSAEVGVTPSNEVRTPVAAVLGVKVGSGGGEEVPPAGGDEEVGPDTVVAGGSSGPGVLAATGAGLSLPGALGISVLLLLAGTFLLRVGAVRR